MFCVPKLSELLKALAETTTAMLLCLVAAGFLFLPGKEEREKPFCFAGVLIPDRGSFTSIVASRTSQRFNRHLAEVNGDLLDHSKFRRLNLRVNPFLIAVEPNGSRLFVSDIHGNIYSVGDNGENCCFLGRIAEGIAVSMACTKNSTSLVVLDSCGLAAWNVEMQSSEFARLRWYHVEQFITCFALYPNSEMGVAVRKGPEISELFEFSLRTGELNRRIGTVSGHVEKIEIAPNGCWMVAVRGNGGIQLFSRKAVELPWQLDSIAGLTSGPSKIARFSTNSQLLVTSRNNCKGLIVWGLEQQTMLHRTDELNSVIIDCDFLDSMHLLSWSVDARLHVWNLQASSPERETILNFK